MKCRHIIFTIFVLQYLVLFSPLLITPLTLERREHSYLKQMFWLCFVTVFHLIWYDYLMKMFSVNDSNRGHGLQRFFKCVCACVCFSVCRLCLVEILSITSQPITADDHLRIWSTKKSLYPDLGSIWMLPMEKMRWETHIQHNMMIRQ